MKITIYAEYNNGWGDLVFGFKIAKIVEEKFQGAEIQLVTGSKAYCESRDHGLEPIVKFNASQEEKYQYIFLDDNARNQNPDMIFWGPIMPSEPEFIEKVTSRLDKPIVFIPEYDFAAEHAVQLVEELRQKGYSDVETLPSGFGKKAHGILLERELLEFDKNDIEAKCRLFEGQLPVTSAVLLSGQKAQDYLQKTKTHVTVNYSHNNAERLLNVHARFAPSNQNVDLIVMGEKFKSESHVQQVLLISSSQLKESGFQKIIYHEIGKEEILIHDSKKEGPVYRIIYTGPVSPKEAINLRKIGGEFAGATGDQSFGEAIAVSSMVVYETAKHKMSFISNIILLADEIDNTHELGRAFRLLCEAKNEADYTELVKLLKNSAIQEKFKQLQTHILTHKNLKNALNKYMDKYQKPAQLRQEPTKARHTRREDQELYMERSSIQHHERSALESVSRFFASIGHWIGQRCTDCSSLGHSRTDPGNSDSDQYNKSATPPVLDGKKEKERNAAAATRDGQDKDDHSGLSL